MRKMIIFWTVVLFFSLEGASSAKRVKRILNGAVYTSVKEDAYDAVRFFASYSELHHFPWYSFSWIFGVVQRWVRDNWYGNIKCAGMVLTPEIIQTACHCISEWVDPPDKGYVKRPRVEHAWEGIKVVYVGVTSRFADDPNPSMINVKPITTTRFLAHPACGMVDLEPQPRTFDYAWILVDPSWTKPGSGVPNRAVSFVPVYSKEHITSWLQRVLDKQMLCMHIGFGYYTSWKAVTSTRLRVGWGIASPHLQCSKKTAYNIPSEHKDELMNWFCVESSGDFQGAVQQGDSGGPVSCDNVVVGVVSGHLADFYTDNGQLVDRYYSIHGSSARNDFAMAIEYRKSFDTYVHDLFSTDTWEKWVLWFKLFNYPYPTGYEKFGEVRHEIPLQKGESTRRTSPVSLILLLIWFSVSRL